MQGQEGTAEGGAEVGGGAGQAHHLRPLRQVPDTPLVILGQEAARNKQD